MANGTITFDDFELDPAKGELRHFGKAVELEPIAFELISLLASRPGDLISKDDLVEFVWGGRAISDSAISSCVATARAALGDTGTLQRFIKTVPRRGFRFVADVSPSVMSAAPAPTPASMQPVRYAKSRDGTRIAYTTAGNGPALLRAGHFLTHIEKEWKSPIWRPFLDRLGQEFTVTRYDQRSTGLSDPKPAGLTLDQLVDDMEAVADAAGLERFPIYAASQGVPVAVKFAVRHPERVSALVLYGGYAEGRALRNGGEEKEDAEAVLSIIRQGWGKLGTTFAKVFATIYMPGATSEQIEHLAELQLASTTPDNAVALRKAIDHFDVGDILDQVKAPTLVIHASGDAVQPASQARVLASEIPGAGIHILDSDNHVPLPQDPAWAENLESATRFIKSVLLQD